MDQKDKTRKFSAFRRDKNNILVSDGKSPSDLTTPVLNSQNCDERLEDNIRSLSHSNDRNIESSSLSPSQVKIMNDRSKVPSSFASNEKEKKPKKKRAMSRHTRDWKNPDNKLVICTHGTHYEVVTKAARNVDFID